MTSNKKIKNKLFIFFIIVITVLLFLVFKIMAITDAALKDKREPEHQTVFKNGLKQKDQLKNIFDSSPSNANFVLLGMDEDKTRTDFIMIGQVSKKDNKVDLVSIPRDLYTTLTEQEISSLKINPGKDYIKINSAYQFAGSKHGIDFLTNKLEQLFDIKIDYYAKIELEGFRALVDAIGGVKFNVPQRMYYNDPIQELYIDLQEGEQLLNGKQAEGLVRYRKSDRGYESESPSYAMGDLKRNQVQQEFIKAMIAQIISKDFVANSKAFLGVVEEYISTNVTSSDILNYFAKLIFYEINTHSLPVKNKNVNGNTTEYLEVKEPDASELIQSVFFDVYKEPTSKNKNIVILNGTDVKGLALSKKNTLEKDGFKVSSIGDKANNTNKETLIYVKDDSTGKDLLKYFNNAKIVYDANVDSDILIVIGHDEP